MPQFFSMHEFMQQVEQALELENAYEETHDESLLEVEIELWQRIFPDPIFKQMPQDFQALTSGKAGQSFFYRYHHDTKRMGDLEMAGQLFSDALLHVSDASLRVVLLHSLGDVQTNLYQQKLATKVNTHMKTTEQPFPYNFTGTWFTDAGGMLILEQKERSVTGTFTGQGSIAFIEGTVQRNQLDFTCYTTLIGHKEVNGKGILFAVVGTRTCTGTWEYSPYQTRNEAITAEVLEPIPPELVPENLPEDDKMSLKYAGYDLVRKREYVQAIPLLEQALQLYRDAMRQESIVTDSYLIDEVRILASLLECYFQLATSNSQLAEPESRKNDFYTTVIDLLLASVGSYQSFLQRTFQRHTHGLTKEITKAAEQLRHWQEQLSAQAQTLQDASHGTPDERVPRMLSLAALLQEITTYLFDASVEIATRGEQAFGQVEALVHALTALNCFCDDIQQQVKADLERMTDISKQWPAEQAEFIQWLSLLLVPIPLHIEGQRKLIAQTQKNAQERVDYTWGSAFRLSDWLERWRVRLPSDVEKIKALEGGQPFFQKLINFYVDVHNGAEALVLSERARTRAFADLLAARSTPSHSSQVASLECDPALSSEPPSNLEEMLKVVQARKSVTIEYFLTPERLLIWIITPAGRIETISVAISKDRLDQLISTLLPLLETSAPPEAERTRTITLLRELYMYLIGVSLCRKKRYWKGGSHWTHRNLGSMRFHL